MITTLITNKLLQGTDLRVSPTRTANSQNIPNCPTLSEATICQTILEGITPKRCSGVEKWPVLKGHAYLSGRFGKIVRFLLSFFDFAHFLFALNIAFMGPNQDVLVWISTLLYYA